MNHFYFKEVARKGKGIREFGSQLGKIYPPE